MKVAILIDSVARGGAGRRAVDAACGLARRGCDVDCGTRRDAVAEGREPGRT
jgi:hypothetical protein